MTRDIERLLRELAQPEDPEAEAERLALAYQGFEAEYQRRLAAATSPTGRKRTRLGNLARALWHRVWPSR